MEMSDRGLSLLLEQVARTIYDKNGAEELYPAQWATLRFFARAGRLNRSVAGLANFLGVTKGPASRTTNRLIKRGYLFSETSEHDRRVQIVTLTDEGRRMLELDPIMRLADAISALDSSSKESLAESLERIYRTLLEQRLDPAHRRIEAD